jgi:hypothetical protein
LDSHAHDFCALHRKGFSVVDGNDLNPCIKSAVSTDLAIYLSAKRGMMAGDILIPPIGLVAGVTLEPLTSGETPWRSTLRAFRPTRSPAALLICRPGIGQRRSGSAVTERSAGSISVANVIVMLQPSSRRQ